MTRYEQGFMKKCAEYGVDGRVLLEKKALGLLGGVMPKIQSRIDTAVDAGANLPWYAGGLPFKGIRYLRNNVGKPLNNTVNRLTGYPTAQPATQAQSAAPQPKPLYSGPIYGH